MNHNIRHKSMLSQHTAIFKSIDVNYNEEYNLDYGGRSMDYGKRLKFNEWAQRWEDAVPLGNGSSGAMVFGLPKKEIIQFNEDTLWSGAPIDDCDYDKTKEIQYARDLVEKGEYVDADKYVQKSLLGRWSQNYLPFCNMHIDFGHQGEIEAYKRCLDLENGVLHVSYLNDGTHYERTHFCSNPDDVFVTHIKTNKTGEINLSISVDGLLKHKTRYQWDCIEYSAKAPCHVDPVYDSSDNPIRYDENKGLDYAATIKVITDGFISTDYGMLKVLSGTYVTIYTALKTNFVDPFTEPDIKIIDPVTLSRNTCNLASEQGFDRTLKRHVEDFSALMNRAYLKLSEDDQLTMKERIESVRHSGELNPLLLEKLFDFGRYLIVSSSRGGSQVTNLQGIWNSSAQPPWCSNLTININTQMNYWPVDGANLSECYEPFIRFVKELAESGKVVAKAYGCRGWTANHNSDLWRSVIPTQGTTNFAFWPLGGPWLTTQLFEHYRYTKDQNYLKEIFEILKGSALFGLDWLYRDSDGYYATAPSTSPENTYKYNGRITAVTKASTMDMCILWQVLSDCIEAMEVLDLDDDVFRAELEDRKANLNPYKINNQGALVEWWKEHGIVDPGHRHLSHLWGLYPGYRALELNNPKVLEAHKCSLLTRMKYNGRHPGWSWAWGILLGARLGDEDLVKFLMEKFSRISLNNIGLSSHPPFQIDGNFGMLAALIECLVQRRGNKLCLLPALPSQISDGEFSGLKLQGGIVVGARWKDRKIVQVNLVSPESQRLQLILNDKILEVACIKGRRVLLEF